MNKSLVIQDKTYKWYSANKRDFPFRKTKDPYAIWISEVMSQQTQIDRIIPYYERFLQTLPSVEALASADEELLIKLWEGLGYYSRVRNMKQAAIQIVEHYGGVFPNTYEQLLTLKGVGPYIAGAIAGICFNERVSAVDGNVIRLFARLYEVHDDVAQPATIKAITTYVKSCVKTGVVGDINQGFIELGATICTPKQPKCLECPLQSVCDAHKMQTVGVIPYKSKKQKQKEYAYYACVIEDNNGNIYIEQRTATLLNKQWEFPMIEYTEDINHLQKYIYDTFDIDVAELIILKQDKIKHIFSHQIWNITPVHVKVNTIFPPKHILTNDTHLITAHKKILQINNDK